jgi:hypothetical protein
LWTVYVPAAELAVQVAVSVIDAPGARFSSTMYCGSIPLLDLQIVLPPLVTVNPSILGPMGTRMLELVWFVSVKVILTV